ncbi:hypothetical protein ACFX1W_041082 [Malus domestica]
MICESIVRKVFPRESYKEYDGVEEAHYEDVVPHIVYWDMNDDDLIPWIRYVEQWVSRMSGDCNEFVQFLLDKGVFGPDHVMEAAFSGKQFQSLAVVD